MEWGAARWGRWVTARRDRVGLGLLQSPDREGLVGAAWWEGSCLGLVQLPDGYGLVRWGQPGGAGVA